VQPEEDEEDHGLRSRRRTLKRMAIEEDEYQVEETKSKGLKRSKPDTVDPKPSPEKRKMLKLDDDTQVGSQRAARLS
jgi:hypothetical protein